MKADSVVPLCFSQGESRTYWFGAASTQPFLMACRLYIGYLAQRVANDALRHLYSQIGEVRSATMITAQFSGQTKGSGFVEIGRAEEAGEAIDQLSDGEVKDRNIKVNETRPRDWKFGGNRYCNDGGGSRGRNRAKGRVTPRPPRAIRVRKRCAVAAHWLAATQRTRGALNGKASARTCP
jgi:RNA recognition motif-containing protein